MDGTLRACAMLGLLVSAVSPRGFGSTMAVKMEAQTNTPEMNTVVDMPDLATNVSLVTSEHGKRQCETSSLVQGTTHRRPKDHAHAKEGFEDGKHGGHVVREFLCDHAEAAGQEARVSTSLNYPERERNENAEIFFFC